MFMEYLDDLRGDMIYKDIPDWAKRMVVLYNMNKGEDAKADLEKVEFKEYLVTSLKDDLSRIPLATAREKCLKYVDDFLHENDI
jgi:hypothetical protein